MNMKKTKPKYKKEDKENFDLLELLKKENQFFGDFALFLRSQC